LLVCACASRALSLFQALPTHHTALLAISLSLAVSLLLYKYIYMYILQALTTHRTALALYVDIYIYTSSTGNAPHRSPRHLSKQSSSSLAVYICICICIYIYFKHWQGTAHPFSVSLSTLPVLTKTYGCAADLQADARGDRAGRHRRAAPGPRARCRRPGPGFNSTSGSDKSSVHCGSANSSPEAAGAGVPRGRR